MEGAYLFTKWCKEHNYPRSFQALKADNPELSIADLDTRWDQICQEYEKSSFRIPDRKVYQRGNVITPQSFGPHLKKQ